MIYCNDHNERTSREVQSWEVAQIAGISEQEFQNNYDGDFENLNADLYEFDFSYEPKYTVGADTNEV